eukprot:scaffold346227_cov24-Prasinocladus_malaysianus.AAC.1
MQKLSSLARTMGEKIHHFQLTDPSGGALAPYLHIICNILAPQCQPLWKIMHSIHNYEKRESLRGGNAIKTIPTSFNLADTLAKHRERAR